MKTPSLNDDLLTAAGLAKVLGLKKTITYTLAARGDLPSIKLSRKCRRFQRGVVDPYRQKILTDALYTLDADGRPQFNLGTLRQSQEKFSRLLL
jgi:hypothetical protein